MEIRPGDRHPSPHLMAHSDRFMCATAGCAPAVAPGLRQEPKPTAGPSRIGTFVLACLGMDPPSALFEALRAGLPLQSPALTPASGAAFSAALAQGHAVLLECFLE
jgi:hypothetical protein